MTTNRIGVRELKNHAPKLIQRAEHGEELVITRHGRPVALLGPARRAPASATGRARLHEWERERGAFERLKGRLPRRLRERFVAVCGEAVVDSDPDPSVLFDRVASTLGGRTFFIGRASGAVPIIDMPGFSVE